MKKTTLRITGILLTLIMLLPLVSCGTRMRDFSEASSLLEEKGYEVTALPLFISGNLGSTLLADAGFPIDTTNIEWVVEGQKTTGGDTVTVFIIGFADDATATEGIEAFTNDFLTQSSAASNIFEIQEEGNTVYCIANGEIHMMLKKDGSTVYLGTGQSVNDITN